MLAYATVSQAHDPVRRVPPEVASLIFELSIPDIWSICESRDPVEHERSASLKLGAVCKIWRKIAWGTPRLWTSVYLNVLATSSRSPLGDQMPSINRSKLTILSQWLSRAGGGLPLSIHMNLGPVHNEIYGEARSNALQKNYAPFVNLINTYSSRLHNLALSCPSALISHLTGNTKGMPIVRSLALSAVHALDTTSNDDHVELFSLAAGMPQPTSVSIAHHPLKSINIHWNNVTDLNVKCFKASECLEVLRRATKLVDCRFIFINGDAADSQTLVHGTVTLVVHNTLENFDVHEAYSSSAGIEHLLNALTLPALRTLKIDREDQILPCDTLLSLTQRSSCSIEKLWMHLAIFTEEKLVLLLRALSPSLTTLVLLPSYLMGHQPCNLFSLLASTSNIADGTPPQDLFLPKLEHFRFLVSERGKIPWDLVPDIFGPIHGIHGHRRPLKYLSIIDHMELLGLPTVTFLDKDIMGKAVIERLLDIVDAGLALQLPWDVTREDLRNLLEQF